jgi:hypothetical protein
MQSDSDRTDDPSNRVAGGQDVKVSRRKTATYKTSADMGKATQDFHAKMDRQFAMTERFIGEWAANQKKSLELQEKQAQAQEKEAAVKEKESAVRNIANMLLPSSL